MAPFLTTLGIQVHAKGDNSLMNKHLRVAASPWNPFIVFYCNEKEIGFTEECHDEQNLTYGGALWDLLTLVIQARNVTFSIVKPPVLAWGICHGKNNCTGMIGMVNRGEVDFALGKFKISNRVEFLHICINILRSFHSNT